MKTQEEIRLKRLGVVEALRKLPANAWHEMLENTSRGKLIWATVLKVGALSDALSWVLGESKGRGMDSAISEAENLGRFLTTGQPFPKMTPKKASRLIKEALEEGPELGKKMLKDQDELLKKIWDELESEQ